MTEEQAIGELFERLWQMRKSVQRCMQQVEGRCPHSRAKLAQPSYIPT